MDTLILGNGIAAVTAAQALSAEADAAVTILSEEMHPYYARPKLWSYIAGEIQREDLYVRPLSWYEDNGINLRLGEKAVEIHPERKQVTGSSGAVYGYDSLLLATGSQPFVPPIAGAQQEGVFVLRTIEDAEAIKAHADKAGSAVVVGGGLLGLEIARVLLSLGLPVTILETAAHLLPRQLDETGAGLLQGLLEEMGLQVICGARVEAIEGDGKARSILLAGGERIAADLVLLSTGIRSNTELARQAGLAVQRGILVDSQMRTSAESIYAAGDAAEYNGMVYGIIPAALEQARAAAAAMTGGEVQYDGTVPSTNLKVTGVALTSVGAYHGQCDGCNSHHVVDHTEKRYRKIVVQGGVIRGAILVNDQARSSVISQLIRKEQDISEVVEHILSDEFDIKSLTHRKIDRR